MTDSTEVVDEKPKVLIPIPVLAKLPAKDVPRFAVVNDELVAQTDGEPLRFSLKVPMRLLRQLQEVPTYWEELEVILQSRGDEEALERLYDLDTIDAREIARKFSQAYQEKEQARLGESFSSSD